MGLMKHYLLGSLLVVLALAAFLSASAFSPPETVLLVYFVPFDIMDFSGVPITQDDLRKRKPLVFVKDHPFVSELYVTLTRNSFTASRRVPTEEPTAPKESDHDTKQEGDGDYRLIADFGQKEGVFLVSKGGIVRRLKDSVTFIVSEQEKTNLQGRILYFRGVIDTGVLESYH